MKRFMAIIAVALSLSMVALVSCAPAIKNEASATESPNAEAPKAEAPAAESPTTENAPKNVELRMSWWGGDSRNERMNQILDLYESQNPGVTISREYTGWSDYWTKFSTQASAKTQPDVSPFVMQSIQEYVNKGVLLPLQQYVDSGVIDNHDWSAAAISPGVVNGELYAITYALTSQGVIYNTKLIADAGVAPPPEDWTVEQFLAYCKELREKLPKDMWVLEDAAYSDHAIESYMRSKGKSLYSADGTALGFTKEDLTDWFSLWDDLRKTGCVPGAALTAEIFGAPYEQTLIGSGRSVMVFQNGNLIPTFQAIIDGEVKITREPRAIADIPGEFFQPTAFGINPASKYPDEAAKLINWLVNDIEANLIFKADYGAPGDPAALEALRADATLEQNKNYDFVELLLNDTKLPAANTRAEHSAAILDVLLRGVYEDISSDSVPLSAGVDRFFAEATEILSQNAPNGQ
jgi:multiple sugar transport system substrate-binding protein